MAQRDSDARPRHKAVRLSELIGQESAPLPVRKKPPEVDSEEAYPSEPEKTEKTSGKGGRSGKSAGSGGSEKEKERPSAYDAAMTILAHGDNSEKMLREKLARKGYTASETDDALAVLREKRYVCDERLMERYASALSRKKFYGRYRIRMEMLRRFDRAVVDAHFEEAVREIDFAAQAKLYAGKNARKDREYLIRRLRDLGYEREQIRSALSALNQEKSSDE